MKQVIYPGDLVMFINVSGADTDRKVGIVVSTSMLYHPIHHFPSTQVYTIEVGDILIGFSEKYLLKID
jgi:hypothetical protein